MRIVLISSEKKCRIWRKLLMAVILLCVLGISGWCLATKANFSTNHNVGDVIDSLDNVAVYFNGGIGHTEGRNLAPDGYNLGIKYQCVEFVKRYYYEHYNHKMPDVWGHAVSFFDQELAHATLNVKRGLMQYLNGGDIKPEKGDLVVYGATKLNPYGHVSIVVEVTDNYITIIQQNPGPLAPSREIYILTFNNGNYTILHSRILGWLRLP